MTLLADHFKLLGTRVQLLVIALLSLAIAHLKLLLVTLFHLLQRCLQLIRHSSDIAATSPLFLKLVAYAAEIADRPWFRKCRNALYHCAAFLVGSTFEDERVAFSAPRLVKNDAYRDRLLVREIEDLVALCEALEMTLPQRKAYFQCFLHVDFMRRSTVSRAELLRYCNLRAAPVTTFLLPNADEATHRESAPNRWDILQLMAVCFSICTAEVANLVQIAVTEACRPEEKVVESDSEGSTHDQEQQEKDPVESEMPTNYPEELTICQQIERCGVFFIGVADPLERNLLSLLTALYRDGSVGNEPLHDDSTANCLDFQKIHSVATIFDVVRLFPVCRAVLIFPCIWTQRILRTRILGMKTWQCLRERRLQLQPYTLADGLFLSVADIIAASRVHLQQKKDRENAILTSSRDKLKVDIDPSAALADDIISSRSGGSARSKKSTPRKIAPSIGSELTKSEGESAVSFFHELDSQLKLTFDQCSTPEEAWRISANHALASVYVFCTREGPSASDEELSAEFQKVTEQIITGKFSTDQSECVRQQLVKGYGYRFAHDVLKKSSVKELNRSSKTPLDERRANQRYTKAWRGSRLVEDKVTYWKEFEDPVAKRAFYYNVRTGESRWEKPPNFVSKSNKKRVRRRRKANNTKAQPESAASI